MDGGFQSYAETKGFERDSLPRKHSETLDEGMAILSRTDNDIRSFLSAVVPEPIVHSAEKLRHYRSERIYDHRSS